MSRIACVKDGVVIEVQVTTEETPLVSEGFDGVYDVTNCDPPITAGWVIVDNQFVAPEDADPEVAALAALVVKMDARFKFGNELCDQMIKVLSIKNLELGKTSQQVSAMITSFLPIEMALRKCALPTALGGIKQMRAGWSDYSNEFDIAIAALEGFLAGE